MSDTDYEKTCFVIMPFGKEDTLEREDHDQTYEKVIKEAVRSANIGLICKRADEIKRSGSIPKDIVINLEKCRFVIADLTDLNANVIYELGIRRTLRNGTVLIARRGTKLPFDTGKERTIFYSKDTTRELDSAVAEIREFLVTMSRDPNRLDSPVREALGSIVSSYEKASADEIKAMRDQLDKEIGYRCASAVPSPNRDEFTLEVRMLPIDPSRNLIDRVRLIDHVKNTLQRVQAGGRHFWSEPKRIQFQSGLGLVFRREGFYRARYIELTEGGTVGIRVNAYLNPIDDGDVDMHAIAQAIAQNLFMADRLLRELPYAGGVTAYISIGGIAHKTLRWEYSDGSMFHYLNDRKFGPQESYFYPISLGSLGDSDWSSAETLRIVSDLLWQAGYPEDTMELAKSLLERSSRAMPVWN